ncbi:MAG: S1 RNA-binding domain-containing protein, partial [Rhodospirillaceae bacterium]
MVKRMLIDATHPEETRVVVLDGTRLDEFDVESSTKKQIKGNIYLAKVVRVEPSLQAAFVEYGGNRHGFLAFSEIHPDYYQIPVADRERLLADAERHHHDDDHRDDGNDRHHRRESRHHADDDHGHHDDSEHAPQSTSEDHADEPATQSAEGYPVSETANPADNGDTLPLAFIPPAISTPAPSEDVDDEPDAAPYPPSYAVESVPEQAVETIAGPESEYAGTPSDSAQSEEAPPPSSEATTPHLEGGDHPRREGEITLDTHADGNKTSGVETVGGEDPDDDEEDEHDNDKQRRRFVASRHYKIQEVIKRRQIMLVQVVKEERGNKGAALTSYLSLAGRYCVLMPNSARGGGVSRKITSAQDRRRLKEIVGDLELPKNMAVILRTAGAERSKAEIKRDYEYLQRTWNSVREVTMQSRAPALI